MTIFRVELCLYEFELFIVPSSFCGEDVYAGFSFSRVVLSRPCVPFLVVLWVGFEPSYFRELERRK